MTEDQFETIAIHAGQEPDPTTGAAVVPIYAPTIPLERRSRRNSQLSKAWARGMTVVA